MKKAIVAIFILITCYSLTAAKTFRIFVNSGGAFAVSPRWFHEDKKPSYVIGGGIRLDLSSKWALQLSFNYCSFYPRDDYEKWLIIGDNVIDISDWNWYQGDHFDSFYSIMIDAKYFIGRGRLSPYIIGSAGLMFERWVSGGTIMVGEGETLHISLRGSVSVGGGIGLEYRLNRRFGLFLEGQYFLSWYETWEKDERTKGFIPLKIGLFYTF